MLVRGSETARKNGSFVVTSTDPHVPHTKSSPRLSPRLPLLFNLDEDISEQHNVARENLDLVEALLKELGDWDVSTPHVQFLEGDKWRRNQLNLYDKEYQLEQPE